MRDLLPRACPHPGLTPGRPPQPAPRTLQVCGGAALISGLPEPPAESLTGKAVGRQGQGGAPRACSPKCNPKCQLGQWRGAGPAAGGEATKSQEGHGGSALPLLWSSARPQYHPAPGPSPRGTYLWRPPPALKFPSCLNPGKPCSYLGKNTLTQWVLKVTHIQQK